MRTFYMYVWSETVKSLSNLQVDTTSPAGLLFCWFGQVDLRQMCLRYNIYKCKYVESVDKKRFIEIVWNVASMTVLFFLVL